MELFALSDTIGVEIRHVDLSQKISNDLWKQLHSALLKHKVIVFRKQTLSEEDQLRFARSFGELQEVRSAKDILGKNQSIMHVANRPVKGKPGILPDGEMHFHNDQSYYECPCKATILYSIEIPDEGGNTLFLNTAKAYAALTNEDKKRIRGLRVHNMYDYHHNPTVQGEGYNADAPHFAHPIVIKHPETGEAALFTSRLMSHYIDGMDREMGDAILTSLFDHSENSAFIYEHVWQVGDLVMWDNFTTQHARTDFDPNQPRILRRVAVAGQRPDGYGGVA